MMKLAASLSAIRHPRGHPRVLAVLLSVVAHAALAVAGYAYVSWPNAATIAVIPVEVIAAPRGPGDGEGHDTAAGKETRQKVAEEATKEILGEALEETAAQVPQDATEEDADEVVEANRPAEQQIADIAAALARIDPPAPVRRESEPTQEAPQQPTQPAAATAPFEPDAAAEEPPVEAIARAAPVPTAPATVEKKSAVAPRETVEAHLEPTRVRASPPVLQTAALPAPAPPIPDREDPLRENAAPPAPTPELDRAALLVAAIPESEWEISVADTPPPAPPLAFAAPQQSQQPDLRPHAKPALRDAGWISPPTTIAPTVTVLSQPSDADTATPVKPPLPRARPTDLTLALASSQPVARRRAAALLPRGRPVQAPAIDVLVEPLADPSTTNLAAPHMPEKPAETKNEKTASDASPSKTIAPEEAALPPEQTNRDVETARLGAPAQTSAASQAAHGGDGGLGSDLRPMPGNPTPRYPRLARERGWQGRVVLEVTVANDGTVDRAEVDQTSGYRVLDQAALSAIRRWRFTVADARSPSQSVVVRLPIIFKLSD